MGLSWRLTGALSHASAWKGVGVGNQETIQRPQSPLSAPTPTQRLQVYLFSGSPRRWGPWGPVWGCGGPGCPLPSANALAAPNGACRCVPTPWPPPPAQLCLPGSQLRALIIHDKCAEALAGSGSRRRSSYLAGQGKEPRGWALALRTESVS